MENVPLKKSRKEKIIIFLLLVSIGVTYHFLQSVEAIQ
jgi:hypothetical protein